VSESRAVEKFTIIVLCLNFEIFFYIALYFLIYPIAIIIQLSTLRFLAVSYFIPTNFFNANKFI